MTTNPPTVCPMCSSPIREKSGVSRKTNKPYSFYGCSNYPNCSYIYRPEPSPMKQAMKENDQGELILTGLREVYSKLLEMEQEQQRFFKIFTDKQDDK